MKLHTFAVRLALGASTLAFFCVAPSIAAAACTVTGVPALLPCTTEELNSRGVYQIKAPYLYSIGAPNGADVTVAVVDTGISPHPEFGSRLLQGYNFVTKTTDALDDNGHGTHVSGIIGAGYNNPSSLGMFGVAYNVNLLPVKVLDQNGSGSYANVASGINYAVGKSFAINLSLGGKSPDTNIANALMNAVTAGMVVVAAAGNSRGRNPLYPARYAKETWANSQIIAVGAVDSTNKIASFSNRAGDTANWFLVAPGVSIYSTCITSTTCGNSTTGYASLSGTSMATPFVTGAVALIKSNWSYLAASQITNVLFTTATDLGAQGVDAIYGRGLINLQAALAPIGALTTTSASGASVPLRSTSLATSPSMSAALKSAGAAGLMTVTTFDSFGRNYTADLAPVQYRPPSVTNNLSGMLAALDAADRAQLINLGNGATLRISSRIDPALWSAGMMPTTGQEQLQHPKAVLATDAAGREFAMGYSGMAGEFFGLAGEMSKRGYSGLAMNLANPYFSLAGHHAHTGFSLPLSDNLRLKIGSLVSTPQMLANLEVNQFSGRRQTMQMAELSGEYRSAIWSASVGRLSEADSILGTSQTGALAVQGSTGTTVLNLGAAFSPVQRLSLGAQVSKGYTDNTLNKADSLVTGYTGVRSDAYAIFGTINAPFGRADDKLSLVVSQPLRATAGSMQMLLPTGVNEDGSPVMQARSISLMPSAREIRTDLQYMSKLDRHTRWSFGLTVREHPDHDEAAPRAISVGIGLRSVY